MARAPFRFLGELLATFVGVMCVPLVGAGLGLMLASLLHMLLFLFVGPTYLFFILVGSSLGWTVNVNRRPISKAAPWAWVLPTIWSVFAAAGDFGNKMLHQESLSDYVWNTLILGNHEYALLSQWAIVAPAVTGLAYSLAASLAIERQPPA